MRTAPLPAAALAAASLCALTLPACAMAAAQAGQMPKPASPAAPAPFVPQNVPVTVTVDPGAAGPAVSPLFAGVSLETSILLPDANGKRYFRPDNAPLITLFRTLGIKSLRIGGNTSDNPMVAIPSTDDIDSLYGFARAAGVKVIYTVRLRKGDPADDARIAKYIYDHYAAETWCLAIGNEPDVYFKTYPEYKAAFQTTYDAIVAAVPAAKFCGPCTTGGHTSWPRDFAADFGPTGRIVADVQHGYPGGAGNRVTDPAAARERILQPTMDARYQRTWDGWAPAAKAAGLPFRLEETNSFYNAGALDVSNTYASSLWGLDYLLWWAGHGADGINFHTGDSTAAGPKLLPSRYAVFVSEAAESDAVGNRSAAGNGYVTRPIGYAVLMFTQAVRGHMTPATIAPAEARNLTAYACIGDDDALTVVLIDRENGPTAQPIDVSLDLGKRQYPGATQLVLVAPNGNDIASDKGVTLGGASVTQGGRWSGSWQPLMRPFHGGGWSVTLAPGEAVALHFH